MLTCNYILPWIWMRNTKSYSIRNLSTSRNNISSKSLTNSPLTSDELSTLTWSKLPPSPTTKAFFQISTFLHGKFRGLHLYLSTNIFKVDEIRIIRVEASLKHKQAVCMRSKMLFTVLKYLFWFQRYSLNQILMKYNEKKISQPICISQILLILLHRWRATSFLCGYTVYKSLLLLLLLLLLFLFIIIDVIIIIIIIINNYSPKWR